MNWLSLLVLAIGCIMASNVEESMIRTIIVAKNDETKSIGEALVPVMFQNGFKNLLKRGASGLICDGQYKYVIPSDSAEASTRDFFSRMNVSTKALVYAVADLNTGDAPMPKYTVTYEGEYLNVLLDFDARSRAKEQVFNLHTAKLTIN